MKNTLREIIPKIVITLLIAFLLIFGYDFYEKNEESMITPRIVDLSRFSARIAWETSKDKTQEIFYKMDTNSLDNSKVTEVASKELSIKEDKKNKDHKINITGLLPDTFYKYSFSKTYKKEFSFKTSPENEKAYRVTLYNKDYLFQPENTLKFSQKVKSELPDFVIINGNLSSKEYILEEKQFFKNNNLGASLLLLLSPTQKDISTESAQKYFEGLIPSDNNKIDYVFEYGNSTFIVIGSMKTSLYPNNGYKERVKWLGDKLGKKDSVNTFIVLNSDSDKKSELFNYITSSETLPKITSILFSGKIPENTSLQSIKAIDFSNKYLTLEIDGESVVGYKGNHFQATPQAPEYIKIREAKSDFKKSCVYCRKLLDSKKYYESIKWYRNFIVENSDKFDLDEAQFEIAQIYDQYLYEYDNALVEYKKLIKIYPNSNKIRQATQRIEYLQLHSDYKFEPLKIFEVAKFKTFQSDKNKAIQDVENILTKYPNSKIEPDILFWLGYNIFQTELQSPDLFTRIKFIFEREQIDRAIKHFNRIVEKYDSKENLESAWTGIGNVYYQSGRYSESIIAYNNAINNSESLSYPLKDKIERSYRNITRDRVFIVSIMLLFIFTIVVLVAKPSGISIKSIKNYIYTTIIYLLILSIGWISFSMEYLVILRMMFYIAIFIPIAKILAYEFVRKFLNAKDNTTKVTIAALLTTILSFSIWYDIMYLMHYLFAFGM